MGKTPTDPKNEVVKLDPTKITVNDVPALLTKVNEQLRELKGNTRETPVTAGKELPGFGTIESLKTAHDVIRAHAALKVSARAFQESADSIIPKEYKKPSYKIAGVSVNTWFEDLEAKARLLINKEAIDRLEKIKTTLESNLSAEEKFRKDMESIAKELLSSGGEEE